MLADYGNQLRLFHCFEGREELGTKEQEEAEELVMTSLRSWFRQLPPSRPGKSLSARAELAEEGKLKTVEEKG